ncbi:ubiquitin thioesterase OTU1 [Nilaparvata lugens]|uniref:ubiquitin thioesterase OTU1 n=1 Tax=Nilaparvata lugens TaxID=108931 RepID=UPI00193DFF44|nr:ubiquitin thioesterase OTU1 [Nilaparvata lugens]
MAALSLKLKTKDGQIVISTLTSLNTIAELKALLSSVTKIPTTDLHVLFGYPPTPLDLTSNEKTLEDCGLKSGDTLIVEKKESTSSDGDLFYESRRHIDDLQSEATGILMKRVVPADNSCLFTSVGFVLGGKVDTEGASFMREIIAKSVADDPENYSEAILGKPNRDYCNWILKPDSWGGAIELAVLSKFYGIEIAVVDTVNAIINRFGEDQNYDHRAFLIFDGIHYDPLYMETLDHNSSIQTIFPRNDDRILQEAEQLAIEAKSSRQYTDVNKFTLLCRDCDVKLSGSRAATTHANETGHTNFSEITR